MIRCGKEPPSFSAWENYVKQTLSQGQGLPEGQALTFKPLVLPVMLSLL